MIIKLCEPQRQLQSPALRYLTAKLRSTVTENHDPRILRH